MGLQHLFVELCRQYTKSSKKKKDEQANKPQDEPNEQQNEPRDWKKIGNQHFIYRSYLDAVQAYTKAIERDGATINLLANRAAAYLQLTRYELALKDSESALVMDEKHVKCLYRKVKALFGMKRYEDAMAFMRMIELKSADDRQIFIDLTAKARTYLSQSRYGHYPWREIYKYKTIYHDMEDFTGSVMVKDYSTKGRGLVATDSIREGELILASKAFVYLQDKIELPDETLKQWSYIERALIQINLHLMLETLHILDENPYQLQELYSLYAGREWTPLSYNDRATAKDLKIDVERVESIAQYNRIYNYEHFMKENTLKRSSGIWILPSILNHDCVDANSTWHNVGDFLFVRAYRDISEGEEIVVSYRVPRGLMTQTLIDIYDFICLCRLCERDRLDDEATKNTRHDLLQRLHKTLAKYKGQKDPRITTEDKQKFLRNLYLFELSRPDATDLNLCFTSEMLMFGILCLELRQFTEAAKIFEVLYFTIRKVPAFFNTLVDVSMHAVVSHTINGNVIAAEHWIKKAKEAARIGFGTEDVLEFKFPKYVSNIRKKGLNI